MKVSSCETFIASWSALLMSSDEEIAFCTAAERPETAPSFTAVAMAKLTAAASPSLPKSWRVASVKFL